MLRALTGLAALFRRRPPEDPAQLALDLDGGPPRTAEELHARLRAGGLRRITRVRLTRNRAVMVSYRGGELRVHEGFLGAGREVLRAIVVFVEGRTRAERRAARHVILSHRVAAPPCDPARRERTRPADEPLARRLAEWHARYNERFFGGRLKPVELRVSRRMTSRLGHYTAAGKPGTRAEIVISRAHVRRHGWEEALHTLLHEMVHQWQDESGRAIDHGRSFRAKAREVGITPSARRTVLTARERRDGESLGRRAARGD